MDGSDLLDALARLGARAPAGAEVVLAGGAALLLGGWVSRGTNDGDVIASAPKLSTMRAAIAEVAEELDLSEAWLNDGAVAWADALPRDYAARLHLVGTFGNLTVRRLDRRDLVVRKVLAQRDQDREDLRALAPTADEIAFVRAELPRIARAFPDRAQRMEYYLAQHAPAAEAGG